MAHLRKQNQTAHPLQFLMVLTSDHLTGATGKTPVVKLSKNGAIGAAPAGTITEIDATNNPGWYQVAGNATDSNTLGPLILSATAASCDPTDGDFQVVAFDPDDAVRIGLTALPNVTANASGGLATIDASLRVSANVTAAGGTALTFDANNLMNVSMKAAAGNLTSPTNLVNLDTIVSTVPALVWDTLTSVARTAGSYGTKFKSWVLGTDFKAQISTDTASIPNGALVAATFASGALNGKGDWLLTTSYTAAPTTNQIQSAILSSTNTIFTDALGRVKSLDSGGNVFTYVSPDVASGPAILNMTTGTGVNRLYTANALSLAPSGGGGATNVNVIQWGGVAVGPMPSGGGGAGAFPVTINVTDGTNPLSNAQVRFGNAILATDGSGNAAFARDAGSYSLSITYGGFTYTPTTQVIDALGRFSNLTALLTVAMTAVSYPAVAANMVSAALTVYDDAGAVAAGVTFRFYLTKASGIAGRSIKGEYIYATSNGSGLLTIPLLQNATYIAQRQSSKTGIYGPQVTVVTGTTSPFSINEILGRPV